MKDVLIIQESDAERALRLAEELAQSLGINLETSSSIFAISYRRLKKADRKS